VVTNHFLSRAGERKVSKDSRQRRQDLLAKVGESLKGSGKVTVGDMWAFLRCVDRGRAAARRYEMPKRALRAGTLHSLVFRNEPWVFELGIGVFDTKHGITAATRSSRRYRLTRDQVFAKPE